MADNDKITLSYFDEFTDKQDLVNRWKNYFTKLGMVNDTASWDRFLNTNTQNLYIEAKYYGLPQEEKSLIRNPFFTFLKLFEDRNQKIDILTEKYAYANNMSINKTTRIIFIKSRFSVKASFVSNMIVFLIFIFSFQL